MEGEVMAKPVVMTISHELGRDVAIERIRSGFDRIGGTLGIAVTFNQRWEGDTLHFDAKAMGQSISGKLDVRATDVVIELLLPALLAGFATKIGARIRNESTLLLEKK
jgi:hypothetical protein